MKITEYLTDEEVSVIKGAIIYNDVTNNSSFRRTEDDPFEYGRLEGLDWTASDYKNLGDGSLGYNLESSINAWELQYDPENTFQIGTNLKGGI